MTDDIEQIVGDEKVDDKKEDVQKDWQKITDGKYKTEAELAKAYKDLEKKLGDLSTEIKQGKEFAQVVQPILDEIRNDPEIFDKLDKKLRDKNNPEKKQDKKEVENTEVRDKMSELIVSTFEQRHNFADLSKDEQVTLRNKIGTEIVEITGKKLADIDLRQQENILEKAYKLVHDSQPTNETEDEEQTGAISKVKSSQQKGDAVLTPEEAKVASSLGLSRDQYISGKKK